MTPMMKALWQRIETTGPLSVSDYMTECLCHPKHGYYMKKDPFGRAGDFTTAPEISQMFGELLGVWAAVVWQQMGMPKDLLLVEMGPGRGTLMKDALRATQSVSGFHDAISVHLVEISPVLKESQKESLRDFSGAVHWHDSFSDLPDGPAIVIANEFFDALPIRQFEKGEKGWGERFVDIDPETDGLRFVLKPDEAARAFMPDRLKGQKEKGNLFEVSSIANTVAYGLGDRLKNHGGAVLAIDYGYEKPDFGETFQALKDHDYVSVLDHPGDADLTAHVDFETLAQGFKDGGARTWGPMGQGEFLERLGITPRAQALLDAAPADQKDTVIDAHRRLVHPEEMGRLFKVLVASAPDQPRPPAFEEWSVGK